MNLCRFDTVQDLTRAAFDLLRGALEATFPFPHAVMLSGGKTPLSLYGQIAESPPLPSPGLHLLYSDERLLSEDSSDSNYHNTRPMIAAMNLPSECVLRVHTHLPMEEAAINYDGQISDFFDKGGQITLGLLGLGADGHTASLFSLEDIEGGRGRWAIPVPRQVPPPRVSVTPSLLDRIERIVFLVAGPDKAEMVERLLHQPETIPAGVAVKNARHVDLWVAG
jgi:6-phosphogluconolactonase